MSIVERLDQKPFAVIGHRGAAGRRPENTLSALEYAISVGADIVEVDVRRTRDDKLVVFHDEDFKRLFGINARVREVDYKWIMENIRFSNGETIPLLEDALETVKDRVGLFIEIKEPDTTLAVIRLVEKYGMISDIAIISFYEEALLEAKKYLPRIITGLIYFKPPGRIFDAKRLKASIVLPRYNIATKKANDLAHRLGLKIVVWTVNSVELVYEMLRRGVDGIASDYPDMLIEVRNKIKKSSQNLL
jgi:glycerophosphoryl diester phosphodiesterase